MNKVLVLGGYGNFGKRIVETLSRLDNIEIMIAGRNLVKAQALATQLVPTSSAKLTPLTLDINATTFHSQLSQIQPYIVIHTSGPFQGQEHHVPVACIDAGSHYIDLADDSAYVRDITQLQSLAKEKGVLIVSGASSVPGLSAAVIDKYCALFSQIDDIDIAIAPGNKAERGEATVKGILSYAGHPFVGFFAGKPSDIYGWMNPRRKDFTDIVGKRWLANVDVPDLTLFPQRYQVTQTVRFQAGLELPILHLGLVAMAFLAKKGWVTNWANYSKPIFALSHLFGNFGSDTGAMQVLIKGKDQQHKPCTIQWTLYAPNGKGPYIPTIPAIIVATKLLTSSLKQTGAKPCLDLFELSDFVPYFESMGIYFKEEIEMQR